MHLFIIFLFLNGCANDNNILAIDTKPRFATNDLSKMNLKGDVLVVAYDSILTYYFNDKGMIEKVLFDGIGIMWGKENIYTSNNLINSIVKSKGWSSKTTYYYNEAGNLTSTEKVTKFEGDTSISTETHIYRYDLTNKLILDSVNSSEFEKYYYTRDELDSIIDFTSKKIFLKGNLDSEQIFELDREGNRLSTLVRTYQYSYDAKGNWIRQKWFVNGKEDKVVNRTIIYKGADCAPYLKKYEDFTASLIRSSSSNFQAERSSKNENNVLDQTRAGRSTQACFYCKGSGIEPCTNCKSRGTLNCNSCKGGYRSDGRVCNLCNGRLVVDCYRCGGAGNFGKCRFCKGTGFLK